MNHSFWAIINENYDDKFVIALHTLKIDSHEMSNKFTNSDGQAGKLQTILNWWNFGHKSVLVGYLENFSDLMQLILADGTPHRRPTSGSN